MKYFEKRVQPRTHIRIQVRFGTDQVWQTGFVTNVSNTGLALLCKEKPVTRVVSLQLQYNGTSATLACEVRWTENVTIRTHNLTHLGLKIVSAPLNYLEIVQQIEAKYGTTEDDENGDTDTDPDRLNTLNL